MFPTLQGVREAPKTLPILLNGRTNILTHIGLTAKPGYLPQTNNWDIHMYEFLNVYVT